MKLHEIPFEMYLNVVSEVYSVEPEKILGKCRRKKTGEIPARHMLIYVLRKHGYMTYKEIAKHMGMCHANAIYAGKKVNNQLEIYEDLAVKRNQVVNKIIALSENVNNSI